MPKKMTNDEFIKRSNKKHSNRYLYENCEYLGNRIKVVITCKYHGNFYQLPHNHLEGKGCQMCGGSKKIDIQTFIEKSNLKHNDYYNYDYVKYLNSNTKVEIKCPIHGFFEQTPNKHINGSGCHKCGGSLRSTTEEFIIKSKKVHNLKYDYSSVDYKNNKTKVDVICLEHGHFYILPSNHLKGVGCSKCVGKKKSTTQEFIEKSNKIHNFIYNYDNVNYINCKTPVVIKCLKHGIFCQSPNSHLRGSGCPDCNLSQGEIIVEKFLKDNNFKYHKQFFFKDLKYKKELKFDFAIVDENNNLNFLLEYNGIQHYKFNERFHKTKSGFQLSKYRDKLKIEYCKKNKIDIFIIRYDEDVNLRLNEIFYLKN